MDGFSACYPGYSPAHWPRKGLEMSSHCASQALAFPSQYSPLGSQSLWPPCPRLLSELLIQMNQVLLILSVGGSFFSDFRM